MKSSDKDLQVAVWEELDFEPSIDASKIGVTAKDGIVTLTGTVNNNAEKYAAVQAAERVHGVRAVNDELKVDLPSIHVRNDEDIASAALNALDWNVQVPKQSLTVKVDGGWVTLTGQVEFNYQKAAAEFAVRNLTGVTGVSNLITIRTPSIEPWEVKSKIDEALRRTADEDARRINVEVVGRQVTLRGTVSSIAERGDVERAAWSAPGVTTVVDDLVIAP